MMKLKKSLAIFALLLGAQLAKGLEFALPANGDSVVGQIRPVSLTNPATLAQVGKAYNIGYAEMVAANPDLLRTAKLKAGVVIQIPSLFILPKPQFGLIVNVAELRVYYFPENQPEVYTFPVAAGLKGWNTPLGTTFVTGKVANPGWTVPPSIMQESIQKGKKLKPYYGPDDPENPLGDHALYLDVPGMRLHGTLATYSIGRRASHGCLRLWDEDIEFLYDHVPVGTAVMIEHLQAKAGWRDHVLYLEVDSPFSEHHDPDAVTTAIDEATAAHPATIDWHKVDEVATAQQGIPMAIGYDHSRSGLPA